MGESAGFSGGGGGWDYDPKMWDSTGGAGMDYDAAVEQNRLLLQQPMDVGGTVPGATLSTPGASPVGGDVLAGNAAPVAEPSALSKFHTGAMNQLTGAATMENVGKLLQSGVVANLGSIIAGPESTVGRIAGLMGRVQGTQAMNEAEKKLAAQELAGGTGFTGGPDGGKSRGLSGLDVLGLSPEQVTGLYERSTKMREAEREFPLKATKTYADAIQSLQSGDLASAQAAAHRLETQMKSDPARQTIASLTELNKLYKAIAETASTEATTKKTVLETGLTETYGGAEREAKLATERAEPGLKRAQAERAWGEVAKADEEIRQLRYGLPSGVANQQVQMAIDKQLPFGASTVDGNLVITNHRTGAYQSVPLGTTVPEGRVTQLGWSMAASTFLNQAKLDLAAKYPQDIQKAQDEYSKLLYTLGKEGVTADVQGSSIRGALNDSNKLKFDRSMDIYREGEKRGWSLETMTRAVQEELGVKGQQPGQPFTGKPATSTAPAQPAAQAVKIGGLDIPTVGGQLKKSDLRKTLSANGITDLKAQDDWISKHFKPQAGK